MNMKSSAQLFRVAIPVGDINAAAAFYGTVLGTQGMRISEGRHYFECGGVLLACVDADAENDVHAERRPGSEWLYFAVADIEKAFEACRRAGAVPAPGDVHGEPAAQIVKRPWGEKSFYVHDPFGNRICFVDEKTVFRGG